MISWFRLKCTHGDEYETLRKRVREAELRLDDIEAFEENIRNMARKVQTRKPKQEENTEEPEDLKTKMFIPE